MKRKLLFLFCFLFLISCVSQKQMVELQKQVQDLKSSNKALVTKFNRLNPQVQALKEKVKNLKFTTKEEAIPYSLEDLQQLAQGTGAAKVRAFDHETGNDTGAMDKITITSGNLTNGDFSFVITNDAAGRNLKAFVFDADGTDTAVNGFVVRPNDYDGDTKKGVWKLVGSFSIYPSSTPEVDFRDVEASSLDGNSGDGDINGSIVLNCTTVTSGAEDCNISFYIQADGTFAEIMRIDGDESGDIAIIFGDPDAPGTDKEIARMLPLYVDGADGSENGEIGFYAHYQGSPILIMKLSGKNADVEISQTVEMGDNNLITTGYLNGGTKFLEVSASCAIGSDCDSTSTAILYGGVIIVTGNATITLPAVSGLDGTEHLAVIAIGAVTVHINPNDVDQISLEGATFLTQGVDIVSGGTTGEMAVIMYDTGNPGDGWIIVTDGWSEGT